MIRGYCQGEDDNIFYAGLLDNCISQVYWNTQLACLPGQLEARPAGSCVVEIPGYDVTLDLASWAAPRHYTARPVPGDPHSAGYYRGRAELLRGHRVPLPPRHRSGRARGAALGRGLVPLLLGVEHEPRVSAARCPQLHYRRPGRRGRPQRPLAARHQLPGAGRGRRGRQVRAERVSVHHARQEHQLSVPLIKTARGQIGHENLGQVTEGLKVDPQDGNVYIQYKLGSACTNSSSKRSHIETTIYFDCAADVTDSLPELVSFADCLYTFRWSHAAACPVTRARHGDCRVTDPNTGFTFEEEELQVGRVLPTHQGPI